MKTGLQSRDIDIKRIWRAQVSPSDRRRPELTAFTEASDSLEAAGRIAAIVGIIECCPAGEIIHRVYNVTSGQELIDRGLSDDQAARIFETGCSGGRQISFVEHPLILVADPAPLLRVWERIPQISTEVQTPSVCIRRRCWSHLL
jgi:hypothetical protein